MRIGELLLERSWVDEAGLARVLLEHQETKVRLCSLLVARGLLDFDHAARALGEQHQVPCALTRHLEQRDPELAALIPAALARKLLAVPIGRGKGNELVVCVRDPSEEVRGALADATGLSIVIAVAPVGLLARIVNVAYERIPTAPVLGSPAPTAPAVPPTPVQRIHQRAVTAPNEEFDVDMSTGPVPTVSGEHEDDIPFASFNLVELDDVGVTKDFSQSSGQFLVPPPPPPPRRAVTNPEDDLPIEIPRTPPPAPPETPRLRRSSSHTIPRGPTIRETLAELEHSTSSDDATEIGMAFVSLRWASSLLFMIKEGAALGHRGHGPNLSAAAVAAVVVPLNMPSIIAVAHEARKLVRELPIGGGAIQARLANMLGLPEAPIAAPIIVGTKVAAILVVGDPQGDPIGTDRAELDKLCIALGAAYGRVIQDVKRA